MATRGQSLLPIAAKVTKSASPCTPLHPPVLATGGMRQRHTNASLSLRRVCARGRIYDRPLLRSSARAEGAFELMFDHAASVRELLDCDSDSSGDWPAPSVEERKNVLLI